MCVIKWTNQNYEIQSLPKIYSTLNNFLCLTDFVQNRLDLLRTSGLVFTHCWNIFRYPIPSFWLVAFLMKEPSTRLVMAKVYAILDTQHSSNAWSTWSVWADSFIIFNVSNTVNHIWDRYWVTIWSFFKKKVKFYRKE